MKILTLVIILVSLVGYGRSGYSYDFTTNYCRLVINKDGKYQNTVEYHTDLTTSCRGLTYYVYAPNVIYAAFAINGYNTKSDYFSSMTSTNAPAAFSGGLFPSLCPTCMSSSQTVSIVAKIEGTSGRLLKATFLVSAEEDGLLNQNGNLSYTLVVSKLIQGSFSIASIPNLTLEVQFTCTKNPPDPSSHNGEIIASEIQNTPDTKLKIQMSLDLNRIYDLGYVRQ